MRCDPLPNGAGLRKLLGERWLFGNQVVGASAGSGGVCGDGAAKGRDRDGSGALRQGTGPFDELAGVPKVSETRFLRPRPASRRKSLEITAATYGK